MACPAGHWLHMFALPAIASCTVPALEMRRMCIGSAWEVRRTRSGIVGMGSIRHGNRIGPGLPTVANMLNHRGEIGSQVDKKLSNLVQSPLDRVQARPRRLGTCCDWLASGRRTAPREHVVKVLRRPAERHGQRFQSSRATVALNGVTLNFPDDRRRHVRAFRKFALAPSKLIHTLVNGFGDGRPIFRHSFLRAPPLALRLADPRHSTTQHSPSQGVTCQTHAQMKLKSAEYR